MRYCLIIFILMASCNSEIVPSPISVKKTPFYNGLQVVSIYQIEDMDHINIIKLKSYPKGYNDYIATEWRKIDINGELYLGLKSSVLTLGIKYNLSERDLFMLDILKEVEQESDNYFISGLYKNIELTNSNKLYYYYYLINLKKNELLVFNNSAMN